MKKFLRIASTLLFVLLCSVVPQHLVQAAWQPTLRVGLLTGQSSVVLTAVGVSADLVSNQQSRPVKNIAAGQSLTINCDNASFVLGERHIPGETLTLRAANAKQADMASIRVNGRPYRGEVELRLTPRGLTVVNIVRTEDYVRSVTAEEMPPSWPAPALEAQAVAARTFALAHRGRHRSAGFDLCTTTHCQSYHGIRSEQASSNQAVQATYGQVLTYQGKLIEALFHTDSGGMTENSEDVWGTKIPYLRAATEVERFTQPWQKTLPAVELVQKFHHKGDIGELKIIRLSPLQMGQASADRTVSGRVKSVQLVGKKGTVRVTGEELRNVLGLRSTLLEMKLNGGTVQIHGYGWGHGLGLSQYGAKAWAKQLDYQGILKHYYQGAVLKQLYQLASR